jgi:hypothetical protein
MTWPTLEPRYRDYNESIKELQSESTVELQRLALEMPDHLLVGILSLACPSMLRLLITSRMCTTNWKLGCLP